MIATGDKGAACSAWARLLLLTLVLLGVGAMHTLGHMQVDRSPVGAHALSVSAAASGPLSTTAPASGSTAVRTDGTDGWTESGSVTAVSQVTSDDGADHRATVRLDPTSVCLGVEVLVLTLAWVAIGAFARWLGRLPGRSWPSRIVSTVAPPASPPSLAALQVLRI
ncbi:hypothetical protein CDO52_23470 [Nocardiopsis gilva YIM 90087]|uniref:Uncharacterized protein n=1 Tax=Nocardiopsis gilva YIM 90087 TaxID=1235441 RepID=A0A223SB90_9ACTN|nr:hypothetical protein [Nocardiopsis gilva]ASU85362.1 hypothetical protein CDO52_23470 [Nocardiopsis gilva YIM 90087]